MKYEYFQNNYKKIAVLSESSKCSTYIMQNVETNHLVTMKILDKDKVCVYNKLRHIVDIHMAKVLNVFEHDDKCIVIEEYISGRTLDDYISEKGAVTEEEAAGYILNLCGILEKIHAVNIVHRDIQPKNVIISADGVLKLIDFDISREVKRNAARDTTVLGTAGYAAPEQFGFTQTDNRTDIYAVGVLFKYMLAKNEYVQYEGGYKSIIDKCTYIDPDKRYNTVGELICDIKTVMHPEQKNQYVGNNKAVSFIKTIPGFRRGNPLFALFASAFYACFIWAVIDNSCSGKWQWYMNVLNSVIWLFAFTLPYVCLANIGGIMGRIKKYKEQSSRTGRAGVRIIYAAATFIILGLAATIVENTIKGS